MTDLNPPLHVGQLLEPRTKQLPACRLVRFAPGHLGMIWTLEPVNGGAAFELTLSEIYERFKFEN